MGKFRKKPVVIEAEQYRLGLEDGFQRPGESFDNLTNYRPPKCAKGYGYPFIETLEGKMLISEGDWIITGIKGERYPCKPDIFEATYEPMEG